MPNFTAPDWGVEAYVFPPICEEEWARDYVYIAPPAPLEPRRSHVETALRIVLPSIFK